MDYEPFEPTLEEVNATDQLIIGLDFGTTFSGIACAFRSSNSPDLLSILDWPGLDRPQSKVPTVISYDLNDKRYFTWGAQRHENPKIEGIKLLLDPDQETPLYLPPTNTALDLRRLNKPAVEVAGDYIAAMHKHAISNIESKLPADYLRMCQKKYVVSVPAVWSDKAKDNTLKAAKQAGMYPIQLIKEPEAAAMYTLHVLQEKALTVGDAFVVCDAGGGTVDLISYEISADSPRLEVKELVPGKGGMAGALGLNKRFEQTIRDVVGEDQFFHLRKTEDFDKAMYDFEWRIKKVFRGDLNEEYFINFATARLQDDPTNNIQGSKWIMKGDVLKKIFQPLVTDIQRLVHDQVNLIKVKRLSEGHPKATDIKAIFLVGGFGSSEYLKQCLEAMHQDIQIIQPHDAWSATVKGAVLSQLPEEAVIISTQATRHYGHSAWYRYDKEDDGQPKQEDMYHGGYRVLRMMWYILQGQDLKRDQKIMFSFYRTLEEGFDDDSLIFQTELLQCDASHPPRYPTTDVTKVNCVLTADLRTVDRSLFMKTRMGDGTGYGYDVHFDLAVTVGLAVMKFSLEIGGREMGSVTASYE